MNNIWIVGGRLESIMIFDEKSITDSKIKLREDFFSFHSATILDNYAYMIGDYSIHMLDM